MKTWSSPKKLAEDHNEAYNFNYLTLVIFYYLFKNMLFILFEKYNLVIDLYILIILEVFLTIIN